MGKTYKDSKYDKYFSGRKPGAKNSKVIKHKKDKQKDRNQKHKEENWDTIYWDN